MKERNILDLLLFTCLIKDLESFKKTMFSLKLLPLFILELSRIKARIEYPLLERENTEEFKRKF